METGNYYHIYNRGINKSPIFFDTRNYDYFLKQFDKYLSEYIWVYSYCLMPNHFHFIIKVINGGKPENINSTELTTISRKLFPVEKAFKDFFISYSKSINKAYSRSGALLQYKFKRKIITNENYLLRLIAYIHQNPVRSGLCKSPDEWMYSSYNSFLCNKNTRIKKVEVLSWFINKENFIEYHKNYRNYQNERDFLFKETKEDYKSL